MTPKEKLKLNRIIVGLLKAMFFVMLFIFAYHIINIQR